MQDKAKRVQEIISEAQDQTTSTNNIKPQDTLHIYCRVSTEGQLEGHSIEAQEKAGIYRAKSLGLSYQVHYERGASAAKDNLDNRPVLRHLLDLCDEGKVSAIFITELDRLSRSPIAMYYIKQVLIENNVLLYTTGQRIDLRDTDDEFLSDLTALLSRRENTIRSKRSKRGLRESALKCRWLGPILPYGYSKSEDKSLKINPEEAIIYKEIVQMCFAGIGTTTIAKILNERGIPTRCATALPNGTKVRNKYTGTVRIVKAEEFIWKAGSIYSILTNPLYAGQRIYKGEIMPFPAIISMATFEKIQEQLKKNHHNSENNSKHFYLLKGMMRCGCCGSNLYGRIRTNGHERYYMCSSKREKPCGFRSIGLDKLNALVWSVVSANDIVVATLGEQLARDAGKGKITELERNIKEKVRRMEILTSRRNNLLTLFEKDKIDEGEFDQRAEKIKVESAMIAGELLSAQKELSIITQNAGIIESFNDDAHVRKLMKTWNDVQKREFLKGKHVDIVIHWHPATWSHKVEITFDSGFEIRKVNAPNAPESSRKKRKEENEDAKNESEILLVAENADNQYKLPPTVITQTR